MSEASAKSMPEAAARSRTPPSASIDVSASQPANAIYPSASAASLALNFVVLPNSFAVSRSFASSSSLAPDSAATFAMDESKFLPTSIVSFAMSFSLFITSLMMFAARLPSATANAFKPPFVVLSRSSPTSSTSSSTWTSASFQSSISFEVLLIAAFWFSIFIFRSSAPLLFSPCSLVTSSSCFS